jgi:DNA-binding winged helix-turn-helix (wHTH) protein/tetratricopeptide (TPR) repeat protein
MPHNVYEFGPFRLDPNKRVLTRNGDTISLTPKATDILIILVLNAGELVQKDELLKAIWPDTFVEEANLTQNIFLLRRALGDDRAGPLYIETVTRRGYRFVAQVRSNDTQARCSTAQELTDSSVPIVAVLPFANSTGNEELEYLVEGLTDNLINNLSRVSKLRVMSRSSVFRYQTREVDPQTAGKELGATVVLVGKISAQRPNVFVSVELVDVATGWQLWGTTFDSENKDLLEIQSAITRQLLATLKLELTGAEENRVTARYTENAEAYQAYLEGRYHWSRYTKKGIEKAIKHFRHAIEIDPNYALAYAGIVDCYLRLATNYLPPEEDLPSSRNRRTQRVKGKSSSDESDPRVRLRFEWDWKGAERELRRAIELKTHYPAAHQWYGAYRASKRIYEEVHVSTHRDKASKINQKLAEVREALPSHIPSLELTPSEQIQVYCAIVRDQIDVGNYAAGCKILRPWWLFGNWPKLDGLNQQSCADLLFTTGELAGFVASSSTHMPRGQKHGEELLHGSVALFEQLGFKSRAAEARIELALCYHRQGLFDIAHSTLTRVLGSLADENWELRSLGLLRLGSLDRHAGRLKDAHARVIEAIQLAELCGPWITGRCHLELASIYKNLAVAENTPSYFGEAVHFYLKALTEFEAVGHHRYVAIVENNMGLLLLTVGDYKESEEHLLRSRKLLDCFSDTLRSAQVDETLARLYLQTKQYTLAQMLVERAISVFEHADNELLLAEALTTSGVIAVRLGRFSDAQKNFEAAYKISERCSDNEGAGLALLLMFEEMGTRLEQLDRIQIAERFKRLLATTEKPSLQTRVLKSLAEIAVNTDTQGKREH